MTLRIDSLVNAVKAHALANYETDGWDYVVEAMEDDEIAGYIGKARTETGAIAKVAAVTKALDSRRKDVQATAF